MEIYYKTEELLKFFEITKEFRENKTAIQLKAIFKDQMLTWQIKSMVDWRFLDVDIVHVIKLCACHHAI